MSWQLKSKGHFYISKVTTLDFHNGIPCGEHNSKGCDATIQFWQD